MHHSCADQSNHWPNLTHRRPGRGRRHIQLLPVPWPLPLHSIQSCNSGKWVVHRTLHHNNDYLCRNGIPPPDPMHIYHWGLVSGGVCVVTVVYATDNNVRSAQLTHCILWAHSSQRRGGRGWCKVKSAGLIQAWHSRSSRQTHLNWF